MSRMRTRSEAKLSRKKSSGLSESNAIIDLTDGLQRNGEKVVTESMTSCKNFYFENTYCFLILYTGVQQPSTVSRLTSERFGYS